MKKKFVTKDQAIEFHYRAFLTDSAYDSIKDKINSNGLIHREDLFYGLGSWVTQHMLEFNLYYIPTTLIDVNTNNGWVVNDGELDSNSDHSFNCWFETINSDEIYLGKYKHGYFVSEDLSFQSKDVMIYFELKEPKKYLFNKK